MSNIFFENFRVSKAKAISPKLFSVLEFDCRRATLEDSPMYLVFYLSNIPCVHFELITVSSVKKTQTSVFTEQDRLCFTLVAQEFKLNFSCCASMRSVTGFESHLVCCICKTNELGQRPDARTAIFTTLSQTEALKRVLRATTYENVSTSVKPVQHKRRNCSQDSEANFTKGLSVTRPASLSLALGNQSEGTLETRLRLFPVKVVEQNCQRVK